MSDLPIEIRDKREQEWYWSNNHFLDFYGETLGSHCVAVYSVLCRYANNNTQECFPSMETIAKKSGLKSRKTVSKAISLLEFYDIISVEKRSGDGGKRLNNIYQLNHSRVWTPISEKAPVEVQSESEPKPVKVSGVEVVVLPEWLNVEAWTAWEEHRKQIKKKLTPLSMKLQLKILSTDIANHVEIINRSISSGWTGLFPLKGKAIASNIQKSPEGKYSHMSK